LIVLTFTRDACDYGMSGVALKDLSASHSNPKLPSFINKKRASSDVR